MFNKLAMITLLAAESPTTQERYWQTKTACNKENNEAYVSGFVGSFVKEASQDTYVVAADLGTLLGVELLASIRDNS